MKVTLLLSLWAVLLCPNLSSQYSYWNGVSRFESDYFDQFYYIGNGYHLTRINVPDNNIKKIVERNLMSRNDQVTTEYDSKFRITRILKLDRKQRVKKTEEIYENDNHLETKQYFDNKMTSYTTRVYNQDNRVVQKAHFN